MRCNHYALADDARVRHDCNVLTDVPRRERNDRSQATIAQLAKAFTAEPAKCLVVLTEVRAPVMRKFALKTREANAFLRGRSHVM